MTTTALHESFQCRISKGHIKYERERSLENIKEVGADVSYNVHLEKKTATLKQGLKNLVQHFPSPVFGDVCSKGGPHKGKWKFG